MPFPPVEYGKGRRLQLEPLASPHSPGHKVSTVMGRWVMIMNHAAPLDEAAVVLVKLQTTVSDYRLRCSSRRIPTNDGLLRKWNR